MHHFRALDRSDGWRVRRDRRRGTAVLAVVAVATSAGCLEEPVSSDGEIRSAAVVDIEATETATTQAGALMPNVVCMDLQDAQDEIQHHGVFLSRSVDATGEGRRQVWDRNWVVVEQSPAPGVPIGEGDALLSVVKDDEASICNDDDAQPAAPAPPPSVVATTPPPDPTTPPTVASPTTTSSSPATTSPPTTAVDVLPLIPAQDCDPNYEGACVPIADDVDCEGGSGNGPAYVRGPVYVVGSDIYDLDRDGDGVGCER